MGLDYEVRESVCDLVEDDYVMMAEISGLGVHVGGDPSQRQISRAGRIAAELVREGKVTPGDLREDGFVPWGGTREESAARIERETRRYEEAGREVDFGDIAWFA
ncbi:hypothetical protein [Actinoalloteichus caeruleus]|uniref:hypothetical protein n=1 Tax=Actinoalloteichus cyanogriseus TaxID=2893586 RepID=UPI003AAA5BCD